MAHRVSCYTLTGGIAKLPVPKRCTRLSILSIGTATLDDDLSSEKSSTSSWTSCRGVPLFFVRLAETRRNWGSKLE